MALVIVGMKVRNGTFSFEKECDFAGPKLVTLCTAVFDLHALTCTIFRENPQKHVIYSQMPLVFPFPYTSVKV